MGMGTVRWQSEKGGEVLKNIIWTHKHFYSQEHKV